MRRRRLPIAMLLSIGAIATGIVPTAAGQTSAEFYDAAVRNLERAVTPQRDGSHLSRLFALRQLHDASLEPLLQQLVHDGSWQVQVHAILGLADISEPHRIDPWLVTQLQHEAGEALIANALDMHLVGVEQIHELLRWQELPPMSRLLLIGELIIADEKVDAAAIGTLTSSAQLRVAGLASLLVARLGDAAAFSAFTDRLDTVPRRERDRHILFALEAIRQFEVRDAIPAFGGLLDDAELSDNVRYWAIYTAVGLDARIGLTYWAKALGEEPSYRDRLKFGMLLLASGDGIPASAYDRLNLEDDLLRRIADAGKAMNAGTDPVDALIALLDLGHLQSTKWAMSALADLPPEQASRVYLDILETVERDEPGRAERVTRAVQASTRLFEIDPDALTQRLSVTKDDSLAQEVILLGLFESRSSTAGDVAQGVRRIGSGRADSLALLLIARHTDTLDQQDLDMLGRIAAGGGRVSDGLQIQAAWLYLRHTRSLDRALTQVIDLESP